VERRGAGRHTLEGQRADAPGPGEWLGRVDVDRHVQAATGAVVDPVKGDVVVHGVGVKQIPARRGHLGRHDNDARVEGHADIDAVIIGRILQHDIHAARAIRIDGRCVRHDPDRAAGIERPCAAARVRPGLSYAVQTELQDQQ
jgi:hypothetical protein